MIVLAFEMTYAFSMEGWLARVGEFLQDCPVLIGEWSLSASESAMRDRDRVTFWIDGDCANPEMFSSLSLLLKDVKAPAAVLEQQQVAAAVSRRQGIGVAQLNNQVEWRLYLHIGESLSETEQYRSFRWRDADYSQLNFPQGNSLQADDYQFHFFPATPDGKKPVDLVHPLFVETVQALVQHKRLKKLSGFWLRGGQDKISQVDLAYSWCPRLAEFVPILQSLSNPLSLPIDWLDRYENYPIRHIAFSGLTNPPKCSIYFSAPMTGAWPLTLDTLKQKICEQGQVVSDHLEQNIFSRIPPEATASNLSVGEFYDSDNVDAWRQVLGSKMHYHFGLFEEAATLEANEAETEAAFDRAVSVLYPFLPEGGRVYDIGCGWGGPSVQLKKALGCRMEGITASQTQFRYCAARGLRVRCGDAESVLPAGQFDCMLLLESLCHMRDKVRLLKILRLFGKRLVLRDHCQDRAPASWNFGGMMLMNSSSELREMVEQAGWQIVHWRDRRMEAMPSVRVWQRRLQAIPPSDDVHLETLRRFCDRVVSCPEAWAASNPLIELVAK